MLLGCSTETAHQAYLSDPDQIHIYLARTGHSLQRQVVVIANALSEVSWMRNCHVPLAPIVRSRSLELSRAIRMFSSWVKMAFRTGASYFF